MLIARVAHVPFIKLVLQPLVENAIYHGIKYKETKGNLKIYARPVDGRVEIVVADDGIGMDEDVMEHIFDEHRKEQKRNGVGVTECAEAAETSVRIGVRHPL